MSRFNLVVQAARGRNVKFSINREGRYLKQIAYEVNERTSTVSQPVRTSVQQKERLNGHPRTGEVNKIWKPLRMENETFTSKGKWQRGPEGE